MFTVETSKWRVISCKSLATAENLGEGRATLKNGCGKVGPTCALLGFSGSGDLVD